MTTCSYLLRCGVLLDFVHIFPFFMDFVQLQFRILIGCLVSHVRTMGCSCTIAIYLSIYLCSSRLSPSPSPQLLYPNSLSIFHSLIPPPSIPFLSLFLHYSIATHTHSHTHTLSLSSNLLYLPNSAAICGLSVFLSLSLSLVR